MKAYKTVVKNLTTMRSCNLNQGPEHFYNLIISAFKEAEIEILVQLFLLEKVMKLLYSLDIKQNCFNSIMLSHFKRSLRRASAYHPPLSFSVLSLYILKTRPHHLSVPKVSL
jgi:hypothetical protein